jgi:TatD DNase family protein
LDLLGISKGDTGLPRQIEPINLEAELEFISQNRNKIVAIGEIGLDYFWDKNRHEDQKENFRRILSFAKQLGKPVIIHSRKAEKDCLDILESEISGEIPVVLHCFSGGRDQVERAIQLGYYLSIPPNIVRQQQFQMVAELTPLTQILTETDSPWLSPFPDQKNEPAFVIETVKKIADIKRSTVERVAIQIWKNYEKVFYGARN